MDRDVRCYLAELVATAQDVLGRNLVGAYAAGSVALGDYTPGRSDVDVALVCADDISYDDKRALLARLRHEALPCPARGLELVVYPRAIAQSGSPEPGFMLELNTGARMPFRATYGAQDRPPDDGLFWYALDRSILHQSGLALLGPPAAEMFPDLPPRDLHRLLLEGMEWWLTRPAPSAAGSDDAVLAACRALVKIRWDIWMSKQAAGRRVLEADPDNAVVAQALDARNGGPPPDAAEARAFQRDVMGRLRQHNAGD